MSKDEENRLELETNEIKLNEAARLGDLDGVQALGDKGTALDCFSDYPFRSSATSGHLEVVKYILGDVNAQPCSESIKDALIGACKNGHADVVECIFSALGTSSPEIRDLMAVSMANASVIKVLIKYRERKAEAYEKSIVRVDITRTYIIPVGELCGDCESLDDHNNFCDAFMQSELEHKIRVKKEAGPWGADAKVTYDYRKCSECVKGCRNGKFHIGE